MRVNDDGRTVRAMDVLVPEGWRDHRRQPARRSAGRARNADEGAGARPGGLLVVSRSAAIRHGAARGFGLGVERVLLFITGMGNIRDVIPFPRTPGSAGFLKKCVRNRIRDDSI